MNYAATENVVLTLSNGVTITFTSRDKRRHRLRRKQRRATTCMSMAR